MQTSVKPGRKKQSKSAVRVRVKIFELESNIKIGCWFAFTCSTKQKKTMNE